MTLGMELGRGEGRRSTSWPRAERHDYSMWSRTDALVRHPHDDGVWLGGVGSLRRVEDLGIDAVVSLCRLGTDDAPPVTPEDHATFWVIDAPVEDDNAHAAFVLREAAAAIERFRAEGKTVLLHCVRTESRTPTVAALYGHGSQGLRRWKRWPRCGGCCRGRTRTGCSSGCWRMQRLQPDCRSAGGAE
jgi:ADP-ribosyl-[dinitrogen reductase] hydrolase